MISGERTNSRQAPFGKAMGLFQLREALSFQPVSPRPFTSWGLFISPAVHSALRLPWNTWSRMAQLFISTARRFSVKTYRPDRSCGTRLQKRPLEQHGPTESVQPRTG